MQANYVQRVRLTFTKTGAARYISHLDLARTLERALNRARIPVAYTQGFNQRPRMQLASALPLGYASEGELADVWLKEEMAPEQVQAQLMAKMAPGIEVYRVEEIPLSVDSLPTLTAVAEYEARLLDPVDTTDLQQRINALLAAKSVERVRVRGRKRKEYDLRPLVLDLSLATTEKGGTLIWMRLMLQEGQVGRPDEVLYELELDPLAMRIRRTAIILQEDLATEDGG